MLIYKKEYYEKWNNKVVLLQNGGGKTLASSKIESELNSNGLKPKVFTRRLIETLVAETPSGIYMGEVASSAEKRDAIKTRLDKLDIIKNDVKKSSNVSSAKSAREKNFFYNYLNIQNLSSIIQVPKISKSSINEIDFSDNTIFNDLKISLDAELLSEIEKVDFSSVDRRYVCNNDELMVPDSYEQCLLNLIVFIKSTNRKECVLCGKKYRSHKSLVNALDSHYRNLQFVPTNKSEEEVIELAKKIIIDVIKKQSPFLNNIFGGKFPKTIHQAIRILKLYSNISYAFLRYYWDSISLKPLDDDSDLKDGRYETYGDLLKEYHRLEHEISESKKKIKNIKTFRAFLSNEVSKLIDLEGGYTIEPMTDDVGILLFKDGIKSKEKLYNILSESQYKRLSLIALKALVRYGIIDSIVLDDPVDSYDDYNKLKTIKYISSILSSSRVKRWYILTNDFEAMFIMSEYLSCSVVFYLPDFSTEFGGNDGYIECDCNKYDVKNFLRKNDLFYLTCYLQKSFEPAVDSELMTCGLLMTLRNLKSDVIDNIENLLVCESYKQNCPNTTCRAKIKTIRENASLMSDIEQNIEAFAEHYNLAGSPSLTLGNICSLFHRLDPNKKVGYAHANVGDMTPFENYRSANAKKVITYADNWTAVINYLFKKMTIVSFIKYEFEKRLINKINGVFNQAEVSKVVAKHKLFKKIEEAKTIDASSGYGLSTYLAKCLFIHKEYSYIYNSFDHGLVYQIMPYYSTSVKDIESLWAEVKRL